MSTTPFFIQVLTVLDIIMFLTILWVGTLPEGLVPRGPRPISGATFRSSLRGQTYSEIRPRPTIMVSLEPILGSDRR